MATIGNQLKFQTLRVAYAPGLLGRLTDQFRADGFHVRNLAVEVAVVAALHPTPAPTPSTR